VPLAIVANNSTLWPLVQKQVTVINVNTAWLLDIVQVTAAKVVAQAGAVVVL
jgi:hypothetical protein